MPVISFPEKAVLKKMEYLGVLEISSEVVNIDLRDKIQLRGQTECVLRCFFHIKVTGA